MGRKQLVKIFREHFGWLDRISVVEVGEVDQVGQLLFLGTILSELLVCPLKLL